jgi:sugar lactone lactonase YvrE
MTRHEPETLLADLCFPEGPRWHDGRLFFSDMHAGQVIAVDPGGHAETIVEVKHEPSGLGWLPDGRLLVVSMQDRRLLRLDADDLVEVADLSSLTDFHCNDMVVDRSGRAYVGNFGFDLHGGEAPRPTRLVAVEVDGRARVVADDLSFPNGTVITPDGRTLIIAESFGRRLTAFDVAPDGSLGGRRVWAEIDGFPDGICLDAEGAVWAACALGHKCIRVRAGGEVVDSIDLGERDAFACMLGGTDGRTLFLCTALDSHPERTRSKRAGRIETIRVEVPASD